METEFTLFLIHIYVAVDAENDVPAASAVAAVGSARRDVLFTVEADGAVAALTGAYLYSYLVYEGRCHVFLLCYSKCFEYIDATLGGAEETKTRTGWTRPRMCY